MAQSSLALLHPAIKDIYSPLLQREATSMAEATKKCIQKLELIWTLTNYDIVDTSGVP